LFSGNNRPLLAWLMLVLLLAGCEVIPGREVGHGEVSQPLIKAISASDHAMPIPTQGEIEQMPAINEARLLVLEWPPIIRVEDSNVIRLTLDIDESGSPSPPVEIGGQEVAGEHVSIPDVYDSHHVIAGARLDIGVLQISPNNLIEQPLLSGKKVDYVWHVATNETGTFQGTVWLYLRFLPMDGGDEIQKPLTAQVIEIRSVKMLGLSSNPARLIGSIGILVSALLGSEEILCLLKTSSRFLRRKLALVGFIK
jgi:hypothetical protein